MEKFNLVFVVMVLALIASCSKDDSKSSDMVLEVDVQVNYAKVTVLEGGTPPFSFNWSDGSNSALACDLEPGDYTITVTDANGAIASKTISITGVCPNPSPCNGLVSFEYEGYTYELVEIGCQCWFAENLRFSGTIDNLTNSLDWSTADSPGWCYHDNDSDTEDDFGKLFNWYAVVDDNICPAGWHVPTDNEFKILTDYLCGVNVAGGRLKTIDLWNEPNIGATNSSGFNGKPSSYRSASGDFYNLGGTSYFWTVDDIDAGFAYSRALFSDKESFNRYSTNKEAGFPVRCIKD